MIRLPSVSVIVPAYNCAHTIVQCMESILRQDYPDIELIIVDDASTDDTLQKVGACRDEYIQSAGKANRTIQVIAGSRNRGSGYSRNQGACVASSEILIFVDSDIVVPPDGVFRMIQAIVENQDILAVSAIYSENTRDLNFISDYKNMDLAYRCMLCNERVKYTGSWCLGIKKTTFDHAQGFSDDFLGSSVEDIEFGYRLTDNRDLMFVNKDIRVDHVKRYTLLGILVTDCKRAVGMVGIIRKSHCRYKVGAHVPKRYFVNLFLPWLIAISLIMSISRTIPWLSFALLCFFVLNNAGFLWFLVIKRNCFFALQSCIIMFLEYLVLPLALVWSLFQFGQHGLKNV